MSAYIDWPLFSQMLDDIQAKGKGPILDRVRTLFSSSDDIDGERRLDVVFVYSNDTFPTDDDEFSRMYVKWIEDTYGI